MQPTAATAGTSKYVQPDRPLRDLAIACCALAFTACDVPPNETQSEASELHNGDASTPYVPRKSCGDAEQIWTRYSCVAQPDIKIDTVGYMPERIKRATVPADVTETAFAVRDVATQEIAYSGQLSDALDVSDTGESVRFADFTPLTTPGTYLLEVAGTLSPQFEIKNAAYGDVFKSALLGLYGQRCGTSVSIVFDGDTFEHGRCHQTDGAFEPTFTPNQTGTHDATGGWHDAGDYGKYTVNGAFSVAFLVKAWEDFGTPLASVDHIPGGTGALPSILAEAKYQLDWLLKMQLPDGSLLHLVCPRNFPSDGESADRDSAQRYFLQASSAATAYFTATIAAAARVFRDIDAAYAAQLLSAAQLAQSWLNANPAASAAPDGTDKNRYVAGGPYNVGAQGEAAARLWAQVELWRTSGEGDLLDIEGQLANLSVSGSWDWAFVGNFAAFEYAAANEASRDSTTVARVEAAITSSADALTSQAISHGYGRALASNDYNWGSNGMVARAVMNLWAGYRITSNRAYLDAASQQVDYLLGRNPFGRSFMTGVGYAPPVNPHHRPSNADTNLVPWPGLLVGGPHKNAGDTNAARYPDLPAGKFWFDAAADYYVNEVAINWNAALIYALAGFVQ